MKNSKKASRKTVHKIKVVNRNFLQKATDATEGLFLNIFKAIGLKAFVKWYLKNIETMRYLVFGGLTTVVNVLTFALFNAFSFPTLVSNSIAWIVGVIFAYVTNKYCVFNSKTKNKKDGAREASSFVIARLITLGIESVMMWFFVDILHWNAILMKIIANIVVIILNFVFSKLFIFKKNDKIERPESV